MDLERIVHEVMRVCRFVLQDVRTCTRGSRNARKSKATAILQFDVFMTSASG
jgi:hypothetical protein